jgi:hypothetical protein
MDPMGGGGYEFGMGGGFMGDDASGSLSANKNSDKKVGGEPEHFSCFLFLKPILPHSFLDRCHETASLLFL